MEQTAEQFWLRGETTTLFHWITVLPDEVIRTRADFILKVAGYLLNTSVPIAKAPLSPVRTQMQQLLQSLLDEPQNQGDETSPVPGSYIATLLAAFAEDAQKQAERSKPQRPASSREQEAHMASATKRPGLISEKVVLLETLTPQELRVLRLLAAGCSNQDIAQELVVSLNTVKTSMKNLYGKLQVSNRTQALSLAHDLQLL